jgi:hypothetical protein
MKTFIQSGVLLSQTISLLILLNTTLFAQEPDTLWTKTFGNSGVVDRGRSVLQTSDGGYIITGITEFRGNNNEDVWLIKTNANGDTMWTRIFGGNLPDGGSSVLQTADGGFIITGYTYSFGDTIDGRSFDLWLIKTNANGDSIWTKTFGDSRDDRGNSVDTTLDGGYIITGRKNPAGGGSNKAWLIKTDSNGDTMWTKTFGDSFGLEGTSVQQTNDGGYIITGSYKGLVAGKKKKHNSNIMLESKQSSDWIRLIKTDSNGDTLWTKTINGINRSWANSIRQTSDDGYIITGVTNIFSHIPPSRYIGNLWLIKTDINGDTLWTKTFGDSLTWDEGNSVQETTDNGYIITGSKGGDESLLLMKTDANGNFLWSNTIYFGISEGYSVCLTNDGGYIIAGTRYDPGFDVLLIKIAPDVTAIEETQQTLIGDYILWQNYPNPFNPTTKITFTLPKSEHVTLNIYNTLGQKVATLLDTRMNAGSHDVQFDASTLPSGIYFYRMQAGEFSQVRKMVLLR